MCECACVKVSGFPYAKLLLLRFYNNCVAGFYFQSNTAAL